MLNVKVGNASVSGTNTIGIMPIGSTLTVGTYPLINVPAGGLSGTFQFAGGSSSSFVSAGGNLYQLTLNNSNPAQTVTVAKSSNQFIINDTFGGASGSSIVGQAPSPVNLPGGMWQGANISSATYTGSNQLALVGNSGCVEVPTTGGSFTPPTVLTLSAGLTVNDINSNGDTFGRGMALGYFSQIVPTGQAAESGFFRGLTLDAATGQTGDGSGPGTVELDLPAATLGPENRAVIIPFPTSVFGAFSTSATYTLSFTIDTSTGQISNVSLSDGTTTDTADYAAIDAFDTTGQFTAANTPFVGLLNTSADSGTGNASNFQLSGAGSSVPTGSVWTGTADTTWANSGNWSGNVPGSTTGTTNTDTALFNQAATNSPTTIDAGRNVMNITFDTSAVSSMTIGTTTGPALILTSGGSIQATSTVTNPQTINAPLTLEGSYTFTSDSTTSSASLTFGGGIAPDPANSGLTTLTLNGANTGANTIAGVLRDNGSAKLAVSTSDGGTWRLPGPKTFTGGIGVSGGTLRLAATTGTPTIGGARLPRQRHAGTGWLRLAVESDCEHRQ